MWCLITADSLKEPREKRGRYAERTLQGIQEDYKKFMANGGNIKKAKLFNNAMSTQFFNLEIEQVSTVAIANVT